MKPIFCALALFTMMAPALAPARAQDAAAPTQPNPPLTVKLDNGLVVTPVVSKPSELERMLDIQFWRFVIVPPAPDTFFNAFVEWRVPGQTPKRLFVDTSIFMSRQTTLSLGVLPVGAPYFSNAPRWKITSEAQQIPIDSPFSAINDAQQSSEIDNPIKGTKYYAYRISNGAKSTDVQPNGDISLVTLLGRDDEKDSDHQPLLGELVLVMTAKPKAK